MTGLTLSIVSICKAFLGTSQKDGFSIVTRMWVFLLFYEPRKALPVLTPMYASSNHTPALTPSPARSREIESINWYTGSLWCWCWYRITVVLVLGNRMGEIATSFVKVPCVHCISLKAEAATIWIVIAELLHKQLIWWLGMDCYKFYMFDKIEELHVLSHYLWGNAIPHI